MHKSWTTSDFKRLQLTKYNILINVQQILVATLEFTGAAHGFMIMSCAARGVKKVGQHWPKPMNRAENVAPNSVIDYIVELLHSPNS